MYKYIAARIVRAAAQLADFSGTGNFGDGRHLSSTRRLSRRQHGLPRRRQRMGERPRGVAAAPMPLLALVAPLSLSVRVGPR